MGGLRGNHTRCYTVSTRLTQFSASRWATIRAVLDQFISCSDRCIYTPSSPTSIRLMVSADVKHHVYLLTYLRSFQFRMVSMRSEKSIIYALHPVRQTLPTTLSLKQFQYFEQFGTFPMFGTVPMFETVPVFVRLPRACFSMFDKPC